MRTYGTIALRKRNDRLGGQGPVVFAVQAEPHVAIRMKRLFGKAVSARSGYIELAVTPENCRDLQWVLTRYPMIGELDAIEQGAAAYEERLLTCEAVLGGKHACRDFHLALPPRHYQSQAAELLLTKGSLLCADDLGLGKSVVALAALSHGETRPGLIVVPASLQLQWIAYCRKFLPDVIAYIITRGSVYPLPKFFGKAPELLICSYHKLHGWQDFLAGHCRTIVFDECQELRRSESQKYRAARHIAGSASYRLGLSATPVYNYGGEFFNVGDVICPGELGTKEEFTREWCVGYSDKPRVSDPQAFGAYLRDQHIILRRTRQEVGRELPPIIRIPHTIDSDSRKLHEIKGSAGELARIILDRSRSQQDRWSSSGQFDMIVRQATGLAKAPYVADFVRLICESGERVILAGWHRAVYEIWLQRLADMEPVLYTGSESPVQKGRSVEAFIAGRSRVLVISLRSGVGLDGLQDVCSTIVHGELDWSPGVHEQLNGRLHRDGIGQTVRAYYLISEDGSDPIVADVLGVKREQVECIRDPDRPLVEAFQGSGRNIVELAERYLKTA